MATGTLQAEYTYDAWGTVLSATGYLAGANPIRYRGYYYDSEIGSYYLQTRYYSTKWKRFWNADALFIAGDTITGTNMYAYCNGNPVMYRDPTGMASTGFWPDGMDILISVLLLSCCVAVRMISSGYSLEDTERFLTNLGKLPLTTCVNALIRAFSNPKLVYDQYRLAVIILGEVGCGSGSEYEKGMQAIAHCFINLVAVGYRSEISYAEMSTRFVGYKGGLNLLNNDSDAPPAWNYAFTLAGHLKSGNYSAIPWPDGITDRHISNWQRSKWNENQWRGDAELLVYIGGNIFYAEKGVYRK